MIRLGNVNASTPDSVYLSLFLGLSLLIVRHVAAIKASRVLLVLTGE